MQNRIKQIDYVRPDFLGEFLIDPLLEVGEVRLLLLGTSILYPSTNIIAIPLSLIFRTFVMIFPIQPKKVDKKLKSMQNASYAFTGINCRFRSKNAKINSVGFQPSRLAIKTGGGIYQNPFSGRFFIMRLAVPTGLEFATRNCLGAK